MARMTRRDFLKLGGALTATMGLDAGFIPRVAQALEELAAGNAPVLWLQGQSCSGCSVSLLNVDTPSVAEVLLSYISLKFHSSLSAATGEVAMDVVTKLIEEGGYVLAIEGAVPVGIRDACRVGEEIFADQVQKAAKKAKAVLAIGACAAYGGIPAAEGNQTGAVSVPEFLKNVSISTPTICIPGCPMHPDWLVGTIVHVLKFGIPTLDRMGRPEMFFGKTIHDQCTRFTDYEREQFAKTFGEEGCFFKLGCAGPITYADCPLRLWNSRVNQCIKAGAPCVGCASESFCLKKDHPLYTKSHAKQ